MVVAADVCALELAFALGVAVRWLLRPWFTASIGLLQSLEVAIAILLLPVVHYQLGLYPGYLLGPVESCAAGLSRRSLYSAAWSRGTRSSHGAWSLAASCFPRWCSRWCCRRSRRV
jgi:hypothetical protein